MIQVRDPFSWEMTSRNSVLGSKHSERTQWSHIQVKNTQYSAKCRSYKILSRNVGIKLLSDLTYYIRRKSVSSTSQQKPKIPHNLG